MSEKLDSEPSIELDPRYIVDTAEVLYARIEERFPNSGLGGVARELHETCLTTSDRIQELQKPFWPLRLVSLSLMLSGLALLGFALFGGVDWSQIGTKASFSSFISVLEPSLGSVVFITAFYVFVATLESRWKQKQILMSLNELRSLAHKIDMHQLTKDPKRLQVGGPDTPSSPTRTLNAFELGRYLEYCSELVSVATKVSALYAQAFPEPVVLNAVDQVELLGAGLSRKIWQKLILLNN